MAFVPPARHLLRAKDLADARYFEPARRYVRDPSGNSFRLTQVMLPATA